MSNMSELMENYNNMLSLIEKQKDIILTITNEGGAYQKNRENNDYKSLLKKTLLESIEVLESTKKAFKSKQIEALRKKFILLLSDLSN